MSVKSDSGSCLERVELPAPMMRLRFLFVLASLALFMPLGPLQAAPTSKLIRPGASVGPVSVGDSQEFVEKLWGKPGATHKGDGGRLIWEYSGKMGHLDLGFQEKTGDLVTLTCYDSSFTVAEAPGVKIGCTWESVKKAFPKPNVDTSGQLDYNDLGIHFSFSPDGQVWRARSIIVYRPGRSQWAK